MTFPASDKLKVLRFPRFLVAVVPGLPPSTLAACMTATLDRISGGRFLTGGEARAGSAS